MTFDYDVENEDGEVLATLTVEAHFSGYVSGFTSGRPEKCHPDEGGELEEVTVYLDDKDITSTVDERFGAGTYERIQQKAVSSYDHRKEQEDYEDYKLSFITDR
jgi:hypothetical protein